VLFICYIFKSFISVVYNKVKKEINTTGIIMADQAETALKKEVKILRKNLADLKKHISQVELSEQKYRHFFEKSPTMIYVINTKGVLVNINRAGARMLGFKDTSEVIGKNLDDFLTVDQNELLLYREILEKTGIIQEFDTEMKSADGIVRNVQLSAAVRKTVTGKVRGYEGFIIDITPRKETERRLAESETKYKTVLDNSLAAIYMFENGGYFSYVNPRMVNLLEYDSADEIIGKGFWEIIAPVDREMVRKRGLERERREFRPRRYKFRMIKKGGEEIWVDMRASHASYLGLPAAVGNFIDITREVKAEEQIRLLTRRVIEGIEEERRSLANDIHDEFGQLLTSLQFDIESLQNALSPDLADARGLCDKVMDRIQKLAERVRDTTSRLRPDVLDHLGLVPTLKWYIDDINKRRPDLHVAFQAIGLKKRLSADVELVLYRVFQEGLNNIAKHSGASNANLQLTYNHPDIIFMIRDDGGGFVVSDDGVTVENSRKGIGLLSMKERVTLLDGTMTVRSTPGKGTVLRVKIPMDNEEKL